MSEERADPVLHARVLAILTEHHLMWASRQPKGAERPGMPRMLECVACGFRTMQVWEKRGPHFQSLEHAVDVLLGAGLVVDPDGSSRLAL